jgi:hypothetical protein
MTAGDAVRISQGFTRMLLGTYVVFLLFSLSFAGLTVLSPDIHETEAYANVRKVMAIGYALPAGTMLLLALWLTGRSNAALRLADDVMAAVSVNETRESIGLFRPLSALWPLFFITAIIIVVVYIVLIYAVDSGLF